MQNQEERSRAQGASEGGASKVAGPQMAYQEGLSSDVGASAAGATSYQAQAQVPTFSKEGAYVGQEGAKMSGATSGVNIETNVPLTSAGREGM